MVTPEAYLSLFGQIPKFEKLIATIRSREISASIILQSKSQLKAIYKDNADTIGLNSDKHRKLYILTLHKLVAKLFKECLGKTIEGFATEEQIQECIDLVKSNQIKIRFKAIFIDEVQIFMVAVAPTYLIFFRCSSGTRFSA